jgi:hypothetical protein
MFTPSKVSQPAVLSISSANPATNVNKKTTHPPPKINAQQMLIMRSGSLMPGTYPKIAMSSPMTKEMEPKAKE